MNEALKLCYWIQGFIEINKTTPTNSQWKQICNKIMICEIDDLDLMKPEAFIMWLKGFIELANPHSIDNTHWDIIKTHLTLTFDDLASTDEDEDKDEDEEIKWPDGIPPLQKGGFPWDKKRHPDPLIPDPWPYPYTPYKPYKPYILCSTNAIARTTYELEPMI